METAGFLSPATLPNKLTMIGLFDHQPRHKQNNVRVYCDQSGKQHHDDKRRKCVLSNGKQIILHQPVDDKEIEANRRSDLGHFNHNHQIDAKPDGIESCRLDQRQRNRQAHDNHGKTVDQATENNVHDG